MAKKADNLAKKNKKLKDEIRQAIDKKRGSVGLEKTSKKLATKPKRKPNGQLIAGQQSLNPKGKPKGAKHMTTLLKDALKKVAEDTGDANDVAVVNALISSAKAGNISAIEMVFNRIDGKQGSLTGELPDDERISEVVIKFD